MRRTQKRLKPHPKAKLQTQPEEVQNTIYAYLRAHSLKDTVAWLAKTFDIHCSLPCASRFFRWYPVAKPLEMAKSYAEGVRAVLRNNPNYKIDGDLLSEAGQRAFEQRAIAALSFDQFHKLKQLRQEDQKRELKERELNLAEEKFQFEAAEAALKHLPELREISTGAGLSSAEKLQKAREALFGKPPTAPAAT